MAVIYATLIIKGKKTFAQVPVKLQEQVRQVLIDLECEELIGEQCRNLLPGVTRYAIMRNTESQRAKAANPPDNLPFGYERKEG